MRELDWSWWLSWSILRCEGLMWNRLENCFAFGLFWLLLVRLSSLGASFLVPRGDSRLLCWYGYPSSAACLCEENLLLLLHPLLLLRLIVRLLLLVAVTTILCRCRLLLLL